MFAKLLAVFVFVGLRAQARPFEAFPTVSVIDKNITEVVKMGKDEMGPEMLPEALAQFASGSVYSGNGVINNNDPNAAGETTLDRSERLIKAVLSAALRKITKG